MNNIYEIEQLMEYMVIILPLLLLNLGLVVFSLVKIFKDGVDNLNKGLWIVIVIFVNLVGPILFLMLGRKKDNYDNY
ncbi:MAG TPA: PLD nuclease N-terminal domain-containing protein [Anaerovoracaceae bacterium]|nr:PLD nuclease N-terminal domain-containing protein [Anaerovoracaceae bacterium]